MLYTVQQVINMASQIENVGIKSEQKREIENLIKDKPGKFQSINQVVQEAVDKLILKETSIQSQQENEEMGVILYKIEKFVEKMLEEELEDKITISSSMVEVIKEIFKQIKEFRISFKWEDKTIQLVAAIRLKDSMNKLIKETENKNKRFPESKIPQKYIQNVEDLRKQFVEVVQSLKGKPEK